MKQSDPHFKLRLPPLLKEELEAAARLNNRSVSAEMVYRLTESFERERGFREEDDETLAALVKGTRSRTRLRGDLKIADLGVEANIDGIRKALEEALVILNQTRRKK